MNEHEEAALAALSALTAGVMVILAACITLGAATYGLVHAFGWLQ